MVSAVLVWNQQRQSFSFHVRDSNENGWRHHSPSITTRFTSGWRPCWQKHRLLKLSISKHDATSKKTWKWRGYGVIFPYMDVATPFPRHFHVVFDVASCLLNLSSRWCNITWISPAMPDRKYADNFSIRITRLFALASCTSGASTELYLYIWRWRSRISAEAKNMADQATYSHEVFTDHS